MRNKRIMALVVMLAFAATLVVAATAFAAAKSIKWYDNFDQAAKVAQKAKKPIMIDFYTDWCGWCKKLDKDTYTDAKVVALSGKFINVKLNAEKYPEVAKTYKIDGYPTIVFTDSKGKEIHRLVGYKNAQGFLAEMQTALKKAK